MREFKAIKSLRPLLKFYPWAIPVIIVIGLVSSLLEGLGISLFIPFLKSFSQTNIQFESNNYLVNLITQPFIGVSLKVRTLVIPLLILGSIFLKNALLYLNSALFSWFNWRISHRLRSNIFKQFMSVSYEFLEDTQSGKIVSILDKETWQTSQALSNLVTIIISICTIIVYSVFLLLLSWQLTLLVGVFAIAISSSIQFLHYPNTRLVKDIASGMNWKRKQFVKLMERVAKGEIKTIVVAHKDRLCRFGFEFVEWFCNLNDCEIVVINSTKLSPHEELMSDFMAIMHCFSSRLYFLRAYEKKLEQEYKNSNKM